MTLQFMVKALESFTSGKKNQAIEEMKQKKTEFNILMYRNRKATLTSVQMMEKKCIRVRLNFKRLILYA